MENNLYSVSNIKHPRSVFSRIGLALFLYFITVILSQAILQAVVIKYALWLYESEYFLWISMVVCQYLIGFPVIRLTLIGLPVYKYPKEKMSFKNLLIAVTISQAIAYAGNIIGLLINSIFSTLLGKEIDNSISEIIKNSNILIVFAVVAIIGPIVEELIFRKFIIDRIRPYGELLAVIFSAVTFGMFHGNFYQLFYAFGFGFILGYIYLRTKNIIYPIILHCVFNSISVIAQALENGKNNESFSEAIRYLFGGISTLYTLGILAVAILGIIFLIRSFKKFYFYKNAFGLNTSKAFLYSCVNVGMILFSITVLVEFSLSIFL